jgi:hypothetical protein
MLTLNMSGELLLQMIVAESYFVLMVVILIIKAAYTK